MAGVPLVQKVDHLRVQLGLPEGEPLRTTVRKAVEELGLGSELEKDLSLAQMADACLTHVGGGVPETQVITIAPTAATTPQVPHVPIPYSQLRITSSVRVHCGEEARYLFEETTRAPTRFGTSKWNAATSGGVTLEITVAGTPIRLSHYALKSANDYPGRDPRTWTLFAFRPDGERQTKIVEHSGVQNGRHGGDANWVAIHSMTDPSIKWHGRWAWQEWETSHDFAATKFRLTIHTNCGAGGCTQLGQIRLFEWGQPGARPEAQAAVQMNCEGGGGTVASHGMSGCWLLCGFPLFWALVRKGPAENSRDRYYERGVAFLLMGLPVEVNETWTRHAGTDGFYKDSDPNAVVYFKSESYGVEGGFVHKCKIC